MKTYYITGISFENSIGYDPSFKKIIKAKSKIVAKEKLQSCFKNFIIEQCYEISPINVNKEEKN